MNLEGHIYCYQTDTIWEDAASNFEAIDQLVSSSPPSPHSLLVFPELCTAGFSMEVEKIAEPPQGKTFQFFSQLALKNACHVVAGVAGRDKNGLGLNEAVAFSDDGSEIGRYRKVHLFPLSDEHRHFSAGTEPLVVQCGEWKVAPVICYDLRFPELFRKATLKGAELFLVLANWPASRKEHWFSLLQARAIENQAFVAGVNRTGEDPHLAFHGGTVIFDPTGNVVARAGSSLDSIHAILQKQSLLEWRNTFPALQDIRMPI